MTDVPIFGTLDAVPPRVGKLWFTDYRDYGSPELGMGFWYRTMTHDPETFDASDPERAELLDFVLEHTSDPAPGFGNIVATNSLHTNDGRPVPKDMESPEMAVVFAMAIDDMAVAGDQAEHTDIQMLLSDALTLSPEADEVTWLWAAFRYRDGKLAQDPDDFAISHLAVRADAGHICSVRFTYPERLDAGVGFGAFMRFVYEWQVSIRRVAEGSHAIPAFTIAVEEDWGDIALALEEAEPPAELIVPR